MAKAVVFGTGNYYKTKSRIISENYEIVGFIDNSVKPGEEEILEEKRVLNPIEGIEEWKNVPIILASAKFFEMFMQLRDLGASDRAVLSINMMPPYDPFEDGICKNGYSIRSVDDCLIIEGKGKLMKACNYDEWRENVRSLYNDIYPEIDSIKELPLEPISRRYGREHGTPIDRYYIERFLNDNKEKIRGDVAEFADDGYTKQFGQSVDKSYIFHVNGWGANVIKANFATGEGIQDNMVDCLICTQVLQFIYDMDSAVSNIYQVLKPGGVALITMHGLAQLSLYDYRNWGEYWRLTDKAASELFSGIGEWESIDVHSYGNVKIATAMLYGLCVEDIEEEDLLYDDMQYPIILCVVARKKH